MKFFRSKQNPKETLSWQLLHGIIIAVLTVLLVAFVFFIIDEVLTFRAQGMLRPEYRVRDVYSLMRQGVPPEGVTDAAQIQAWMTFDYVNTVFRLPPAILRNALSIIDTRYPRISILHFARETGRNPADVLMQVQMTVRQALMAGDARH